MCVPTIVLAAAAATHVALHAPMDMPYFLSLCVTATTRLNETHKAMYSEDHDTDIAKYTFPTLPRSRGSRKNRYPSPVEAIAAGRP